jgi:succinate-semialdehyde dehydrogenase/glutarate-semialdehyde dehydrogenase
MDAAVDTAVRARIINSGQSCIAAKRFIVHERIADDFEKRFVQAMQSLVVGDPTDPQTHVGPLAARQLVVDLERQVNESVQRGATLLTGGKPLARRGFFFEPTVLANIPRDAPAFSEELFGPVASVFRADDAADAVRIANDSRFGLGASVWTTEVAEAARFARELEVGAVFVNGMVASDPRYPFGGVKKSGYGRELSDYGLREFVNIKMVRMFGLEGGGLESRSTLAE